MEKKIAQWEHFLVSRCLNWYILVNRNNPDDFCLPYETVWQCTFFMENVSAEVPDDSCTSAKGC